MGKRCAINVYVPPELHDQLRDSGINFSEVARAAWRDALQRQYELEKALGPLVPVPPGRHKRPYARRRP